MSSVHLADFLEGDEYLPVNLGVQMEKSLQDFSPEKIIHPSLEKSFDWTTPDSRRLQSAVVHAIVCEFFNLSSPASYQAFFETMSTDWKVVLNHLNPLVATGEFSLIGQGVLAIDEVLFFFNPLHLESFLKNTISLYAPNQLGAKLALFLENHGQLSDDESDHQVVLELLSAMIATAAAVLYRLILQACDVDTSSKLSPDRLFGAFQVLSADPQLRVRVYSRMKL